jgi:hypothetical protein
VFDLLAVEYFFYRQYLDAGIRSPTDQALGKFRICDTPPIRAILLT